MKNAFYWVEGPWIGRLAIISRPRGGDWLEDEIIYWHKAGIDAVVSLLTPGEEAELELIDEKKLCSKHSIQFYSFPIADRGIPLSMKDIKVLLKKLEKALTAGKTVAIHCRQGIGRSAMIAAALLMASGMTGEDAFQSISLARGFPVPDTLQQKEWVKKLGTKMADEYAMMVSE
ncbi:dual specificity protein phosphatase family protein [candidate division KSB1 bacterium]|nr:dual specificity protein phosphatase family protein [candidate division KSB1 bacterium]